MTDPTTTTGDSPAIATLACFPGTAREYTVCVGPGALELFAHQLAGGNLAASAIVVITDANVWRWHGLQLLGAFDAAGVSPPPLVYVLPPGEGSKTRETKERIEDWMLANNCLRDTLVIAFGGGVIGDLSGYVASTYMRGVAVVQIPTTLLAMVDSSIGGKTGVDTPAGKNLVGTFHQPSRVVVDTRLLATLPLRELSNGMAEIIKAGAIADADLFDACERHAEAILGGEDLGWAASEVAPDPEREARTTWAPGAGPAPLLRRVRAEGGVGASADGAGAPPPAPRAAAPVRRLDAQLLARVITAAARIKLGVVSADERESGPRATLNFGHTIGHGIEALTTPGMLHGEAVAIGMVKEAEVARALGHCDSAVVGRLKRVLKAYALPTGVPAHLAVGAGLAACLTKMGVDKKNSRAVGRGAGAPVTIKCVLLRRIGCVVAPPYAHGVSPALLRRVLSAAVAVEARPHGSGAPAHPAAPTSGHPALSPAAAPPRLVTVRAPGSKSLSNRALLLSGLATGTTHIGGLLASDDTQVMLDALAAMGASVAWEEGPAGQVAVVTGTGGVFTRPARGVYVGNAGTASRFLASVLCLLPPGPPGEGDGPGLTLAGNARMAVRPIGPLVEALREQGARIEYAGANVGCPPLRFLSGVSRERDSDSAPATGPAPAPAPRCRHRVVRLAGALSSQYVSSVLMAAPFFPPVGGAGEDASEDPGDPFAGFTELILAEEAPTSLPYIAMTTTVMRDFGVQVVRLADNHYLVPRRAYAAPPSGRYEVESDASSASYAAALGVLAPGCAGVVLEGIGSGSTQGDAGFPALLGRMGAGVAQGLASTTLRPPPDGLHGLRGIDVNMADQTDAFMTLAAVAVVAAGPTRITGIGNQRVKECNRIAAMVCELGKLGVVAAELPDGIEIQGVGGAGGAGVGSLRPATIHCYDDHRIAMSFAVLASLVPGLVLDDAACTEKTYPEFWDMLGDAFGLEVRAADSAAVAAPAPVAAPAAAVGQLHHGGLRAPLVLVGMRGAGKSSLGARAARWLSASSPLGAWAAVDLDRELEAAAGGRSCSDIVAQEGWAAFREREAAVLRAELSRPPVPAADSAAPGGAPAVRWNVLVCGGGVVETPACRAMLREHVRSGGVVVEVRRDIHDIAEDLDLARTVACVAGGGGGTEPPPSAAEEDAGRPAYAGGATLHETYARRRALFAEVASHVFYICRGDRSWDLLSTEWCHWVSRLLGRGLDTVADETVQLVSSHRAAAAAAAGASHPAFAPPTGARAAPVVRPTLEVLRERAQCEGELGSAFVCLAVSDLRELLLAADEPCEGLAADESAGGGTLHTMPTADEQLQLARRLHKICLGSDAVELRVDCLDGMQASPSGVHDDEPLLFQLALLRRLLHLAALPRAVEKVAATPTVAPLESSPLPVILTLRSDAEGGNFVTSTPPLAAEAYLRLNLAGLRAGVDILDLEAGRCRWPPGVIAELAARAAASGTGVIASAHWPTLPVPCDSDVREALRQCASVSPNAAVKLVALAPTCDAALRFRASAQSAALESAIPAERLIVIAMGSAGSLTRVLNATLTPVTHPALPRRAAPGQLSVEEIRALREKLGLSPSGHCYLFGSPIAASVSPQMHTEAFRATHAPLTYSLYETTSFADMEALLRNPNKKCLGGNVTIPLKQDALLLADSISPEVSIISAVNTVVVCHTSRGVELHAENTDWIGIFLPLRSKLSAVDTARSQNAIIFGAGGTAAAACFAIRALGLVPVVINRTVKTGTNLVRLFDGTFFPSVPAGLDCCVIINTLPGSVTCPVDATLLQRCRPVVFDVTYRPLNTPLLQLAEKCDCPVVHGIEMLLAQGFASEGLWSGRMLPPLLQKQLVGCEAAEISSCFFSL